MLHRHTEVKFRDNQENRVGQFPKTPKNASSKTQSSKFVTPAPKPRVALGAKSTNVHHRQFSSAKTGKRHSPIAAPKPPASILPQEKLQELEGGAALRAALARALATGVDVPDVEYTPPPVVEPRYVPDDAVPLDWESLRILRDHVPRAEISFKIDDDEKWLETPPFEFIEEEIHPKASGLQVVQSKSTISSKPRGFAAPTAAAQAKAKTPPASARAGKESSKSLPSKHRPMARLSALRAISGSSHSSRMGISTTSAMKGFGNLSVASGSDFETPATDVVPPFVLPDLAPIPLFEIDYDVSDEDS